MLAGIDPSWIESLTHGRLLARLSASPRARRHCEAYLLQAAPAAVPPVPAGAAAHSPEAAIVACFEGLSAQRFGRTLELAGLCLAAPSVAQLVSGTQLAALVAHFGMPAYRGGLRLGFDWASQQLVRGLPENDLPDPPTVLAPDAFGSAGCRLFCHLAHAMPRDWLTERLLQIPRSWFGAPEVAIGKIDADGALALFEACRQLHHTGAPDEDAA